MCRRDGSGSPVHAEERRGREDDRDTGRHASADRAGCASMDEDAPRSNGAAERRDPQRDNRDSKENQQEHSNSDRRKVLHPCTACLLQLYSVKRCVLTS